MAGGLKESGKTSFFEKGVEEMLEKLASDQSEEAESFKKRASRLRDRARAWTDDTSVDEKREATNELFSLFRTVMDRK